MKGMSLRRAFVTKGRIMVAIPRARGCDQWVHVAAAVGRFENGTANLDDLVGGFTRTVVLESAFSLSSITWSKLVVSGFALQRDEQRLGRASSPDAAFQESRN